MPTKNIIQVTFVIGRWTRRMRIGDHSAALLVRFVIKVKTQMR